MKIHLSRPTKTLLLLLASALLLGSLWLATLKLESGAPVPAIHEASISPVIESGPVGAEAYDEKLAEAAGQQINGQDLEAAARLAAERYEQRLDALARTVVASGLLDHGLDHEPDANDWRPVFAQLERDHPPNANAVLTAYRDEVEKQRRFLEPLALFPEPEQEVRVVVNENENFRRYFSLAMYLDGLFAVTLEPPEPAPDSSSYLVNHCWICIPPLVAHEVAPGHHVAYSVARREIANEAERLAANRQQVVYHEGWALYSEQLMLELGYYDGNPAGEIAAVRLLYLRALRAWIDPALHRGDLTREQAVEVYERQAGLSGATAEAEVARHLKDPVLKSSYFIGLRQVEGLRREVLRRQALDSGMGLAEFHHRFLGRPRPIPTIAREVFDVELPDWSGESAGHQGISPG